MNQVSNIEQEELKASDLFMLKLIVAHWIVATFVTSIFFDTYFVGFIIGGLITLGNYLAYKFYRGTTFYRSVVAISLMSFSALFIQQTYGRIEFHFHVFVALAFLTIYRDRTAVAVGSIFIVLHHLIFNYLQQYNVSIFDMQIVVFNYGCGLDIVLLHGVFVLAEWIVLDRTINRKIQEFNMVLEAKNELSFANATLAKQKQELKHIFNNAQIGLMYITGDRVLIKANQHLADIFGYNSPEEMIGFSMQEFHLSKERFEEYGKLYFEPLKMGAKHNVEYQLKKKDGTVIWCELSGKTIDENIPADMSKGVMWVIKDITQQKHKNEEFELMFNYSKDGIAILDLESNFVKTNKAYCDMLEFTKEEILKESCIGLTPIEEREKAKEALGKIIEDRYILNFEKHCLKKDKSIITVNMSGTLLPDNKRVLVVTKDISQLKLLEEQSKNASMGEMIGNIAHQWRQPLSVISTGATGMLMQKQIGSLSDEQFNKTCNAINENAQYLSKTIDDFRDFIKGDRKYVKFNLQQVIENFLNLVNPSFKRHNFELILELDDSIELYGYPNELIQCFMNIFNNAKDALKDSVNEKKYIFIESSLEDDKIMIKFRDNAGGIDEKVLPRIFEPYFTTKHQKHGTGLGLSMTYNLITGGMKGSITAVNVNFNYEDEFYQGAELTITIPHTKEITD